MNLKWNLNMCSNMAPCVIHWFSTFTIVSFIKLVSETQKYTLLNSQSVESEKYIAQQGKNKAAKPSNNSRISLIGRTKWGHSRRLLQVTFYEQFKLICLVLL